MKKQNPKLALALGVGIPVVLFLVWFVSSYLEHSESEALAERGVLGTARIVAYEKTGASVNRNPELRFRIEIHPDRGGAPFVIEKEIVVEPMEAPRLQMGILRRLRYLPEEPETFRFED